MDMKSLINLVQVTIANDGITPSEISELVEMIKPLIYGVGNELHNIYKDYANNKEWFKTNATIRKNKFDAYIEAGFTEDMALTFLLNDDIMLMKQMEKLSSCNVNTASPKQ